VAAVKVKLGWMALDLLLVISKYDGLAMRISKGLN